MKITFFAGLRHRLFNMLPYLAVSLLIWAVCVLSSFGGERETFFSVFTEAVGGVEHSGQFDLFGFFRYFGTFFAGLFLGMAGSVLDSEAMPYFVLPRSKSFFKWWIKTVSSALLWCVLYCLIGIAVCAAAAEKVGTLSAFELMRMAAYPLALGASMCVLCLLRFLLGQKPAAARTRRRKRCWNVCCRKFLRICRRSTGSERSNRVTCAGIATVRRSALKKS